MTTRHVSAQNDYPFYDVPEALRPVAFGILDVYFVIQGRETGILNGEESSSSDSSAEPDSISPLVQIVVLHKYEDLGGSTKFTFRASSGNRYWDVTFTVPQTAGDISQVNNDDGSDCRAVLIYNGDLIITGSQDWVGLGVEPGRAQFHTEQVDSLAFFNIWRCNGSEESDSSVEVLSLGQSSGEMELDLADGYNTVLAFDSSLEIIGGVGLGQGVVPDAGNTAPGCEQSSSEQELDLDDVVATINGIVPDAGDIPIGVVGSLGIQRTEGRIEFIIRNQ